MERDSHPVFTNMQIPCVLVAFDPTQFKMVGRREDD